MEKEAKRTGVRFNSFLGTPANFDVDDKNEILAMEWASAAIKTWESRQVQAHDLRETAQVQWTRCVRNFDIDDENDILAMEWASPAIELAGVAAGTSP